MIKCSVKSLLLTLTISASFGLYAHEGHVNKEVQEACHDKELSSSCSYLQGENKLYKGTCRKMSDTLMCVRNQPIETILQPLEEPEMVKHKIN